MTYFMRKVKFIELFHLVHGIEWKTAAFLWKIEIQLIFYRFSEWKLLPSNFAKVYKSSSEVKCTRQIFSRVSVFEIKGKLDCRRFFRCLPWARKEETMGRKTMLQNRRARGENWCSVSKQISRAHFGDDNALKASSHTNFFLLRHINSLELLRDSTRASSPVGKASKFPNWLLLSTSGETRRIHFVEEGPSRHRDIISILKLVSLVNSVLSVVQPDEVGLEKASASHITPPQP